MPGRRRQAGSWNGQVMRWAEPSRLHWQIISCCLCRWMRPAPRWQSCCGPQNPARWHWAAGSQFRQRPSHRKLAWSWWLGFGPVGQALGARLAALGANVTVCARRAEQRALAESLGLRGAELARLAALAPAFDTVVNTIPAPVLTEPVLAALRPGSLIVDLASKPGGTDFAAAQRLGCKAIHALSLPAACAPDTAGEAVARTVLTILREREEHT